MSRSSTDGRASVSILLSRESTSSSSESGLAPATRPCRMHPVCRSASILPVSSTLPRSPLLYSQKMSSDPVVGAVGLAAVTAKAREPATAPSTSTPAPATTLAQKFGPPPHLQHHGRACINCPSHPLCTIDDMLGLGTLMPPACPSSRRHRLSQTTRDHPSFPRMTTRTSPLLLSSSPILMSGRRRPVLLALRRQQSLDPPASARVDSPLQLPPVTDRLARRMLIFSCI